MMRMAGELRIGSGIGDDYLALLKRRAAEGQATPPQKRGWKEGMMSRRIVADGGRRLEGYALYVPDRVLPTAKLNMYGALTLPAEVVARLGPHVQVLFSADRKALALRHCNAGDEGAMVLQVAEGKKSSSLRLGPVFKHFGVRITGKSSYGAVVANGILVLALQGIDVEGRAGEG